MSKELFDTIRGMVRRVTLRNIKDDGATQTASIEVADGVWRDDVEIHQPYGTATNAPEDGALGIALALGGDQGDILVLPAANPSKRLGKLPKGAAGSYNEHGDRVLILPDGTIEVRGATALDVKIGGVTFKVTAAGVDITGGYVKHNGVNIGFDHHHKDTMPGGGTTGDPV